MLSLGSVDVSLRIAAGVAPVALYFLILGLLNSRRHPQLLTGRRDAALLVAVLGPLFVLPVVNWAGASWLTLASVAAALGAGAFLLGGRRASWVIYNLTVDQACGAVGQALEAMGMEFRREAGMFHLAGGDAAVRIDSFPLLRNVSVHVRGCDDRFARRFERALLGRLTAIRAETTPMALALLLVATAMLVVPLALVARQAGQIVRTLTDLLQ